MNWVVRAKIQNAIDRLPSALSYAVYYRLQRMYGELKNIDPIGRFLPGVETWKRIRQCGHDPAGKTFFEVGTGRVPMVPLAYWLMGAERTVTMDINPYVKEELVAECLQRIAGNRLKIEELFGPLLVRERLDSLIELQESGRAGLREVMDLSRVDYRAPANAAATGLVDGSIDYHTSYNVLEHIPPGALQDVFREGNRILAGDGLFVHRIDYSDHFAHSDRSISAVNFLKYSDAEWDKLAGNKYMYMNRLRHDDIVGLLEAIGHHLLVDEPDVDRMIGDILRNGQLTVHERFKNKSASVLAATSAWIVSRK